MTSTILKDSSLLVSYFAAAFSAAMLAAHLLRSTHHLYQVSLTPHENTAEKAQKIGFTIIGMLATSVCLYIVTDLLFFGQIEFKPLPYPNLFSQLKMGKFHSPN